MQTLQGAPLEAYSPKTKSKDQIFTFLICQSFGCSDDIILTAIREGHYEVHECFNLLLSTYGKLFAFTKGNKAATAMDGAIGADNLASIKCEFPFIYLLKQLHNFIGNRSQLLNVPSCDE